MYCLVVALLLSLTILSFLCSSISAVSFKFLYYISLSFLLTVPFFLPPTASVSVPLSPFIHLFIYVPSISTP